MSLIKIINLPTNEIEFKIVQLYHNNEAVMLCGSRKLGIRNYHYAILEDYLKENNIAFDTFAPNLEYPRFFVPRLEKENVYKVAGMGFAGIDQPIKYFQLPYGSSKDYKIEPDKEFQKILREIFKEDSSYWEELKNTAKN